MENQMREEYEKDASERMKLQQLEDAEEYVEGHSNARFEIKSTGYVLLRIKSWQPSNYLGRSLLLKLPWLISITSAQLYPPNLLWIFSRSFIFKKVLTA
jgi:hypothetical protein